MRNHEHLGVASGVPMRAVLAWLGVRGGRSETLPSLAAVHPGPPRAGRWIGLATVPTRCIRGTASTTASASRAIDFRPLAGREPADWRSRWARLEAAVDDQVVLPPVELIRAGGEYWVLDGHNRVALAKEHGQLWIDADITELDVVELTPTAPVLGSEKHAAKAA
jgi:hypothetical protein